MKKYLLIAALALAALTMRAQERINDTVVGGVRYAIMLDNDGEVSAYKSAVLFDERQAVIDLNERLRNIAVYQTVAVPCAVGGALALSHAFPYNPASRLEGEHRYKCEHPGWAVFGAAASVTSLVFGILTYAQLWTPRLYVNQEGLVFSLDGKKTKYYKHEFKEEDE